MGAALDSNMDYSFLRKISSLQSLRRLGSSSAYDNLEAPHNDYRPRHRRPFELQR